MVTNDASTMTPRTVVAMQNDGLEAARVAPPGGKVLDLTQKRIDEMEEYVKRSKCSEIMQDLYAQIVVSQPDVPIDFLIEVLEARV
mmetsp:Transcript_646/g.955  ORF Transcript_646/g.955 Transcript_646/m.955 type:complete len:86 (-) Transcript_646:13-270(-)